MMSVFVMDKLRMVSRMMARLFARAGLLLLLITVVYAIVGTLLALVPVNRQPSSGKAVTVYLYNNDVHTDIVVPTLTERIDWSKVVPPGDTESGVQEGYLAFGWGSRDFYLNFRKWSDVLHHPLRTLCTVPCIVSGLGETALHTRYETEPTENERYRRLVLSETQYDILVKYILESGKRSDAGTFVRIPRDGYDANDAFYEGVGHYSPLFTCNTWANSALKSCGQKCCLWTALSFPIFLKYPREDNGKDIGR